MRRGAAEAAPAASPAGRTIAGISRALLTPCRRLGLSRKRHPASPLALTPAPSSPCAPPPCEISTPEPEPSTPNSTDTEHNENIFLDECPPTRRKFNKLISSIASKPITLTPEKKTSLSDEVEYDQTNPSHQDKMIEKEACSTTDPVQDKLASRTENKEINPQDNKHEVILDSEVILPTKNKSNSTPKRLQKQKSINLTRKCMVVINKRVLKVNTDTSDGEETDIENKNTKSVQLSTPSKRDSLSHLDDVPLSNISTKNKTIDELKNYAAKKRPRTLILDEEDSDFCDQGLNTLSNKIKKLECSNIVKLESTKNKFYSRKELEKKVDNRPQKSKQILDISKVAQVHKCSQDSRNSSDAEDDEFDCRKTILIRKSYGKVDMQKAKSTGSITLKDIEDIKLRIKMKQNALLAKSGGHKIIELTELMKKWRKGCHEALMELLDIMKKKVPEKENMNTLELLKMLNIPPALVDYNSEDDVFVSPE